ncbi:MAG: VOC family protein [Bacteroidota bacterium]|nr:VOC family protein [Bacteroidota bacterium]MDP4232097.1 VOC family protein [Bacteroidota bacterium]MDP4241196.1 VOC family protein [Bacteroidota bacterium]MDP4286588.1 VOC family protein [Bacteroidota bacterium]
MTQINAYVTFEGNCREAMSFYHNCLGGELLIQTIGGSSIEDQCPTSMKDQILHASLCSDALTLMGSDMIGPDGFHQGNNIALALHCSTEEEIETFFSKLSLGGRVIHPLSVEFWGATFGMVTDRFGIRWMLSYDETLHVVLHTKNGKK